MRKLNLLSINDYELMKKSLLVEEDVFKAISFVNPFSYYLMIDGGYSEKGIDGFFVDGIFLQKLARFAYSHPLERISFDYSSIAEDFFNFCQQQQLSVSFLGGNQDEILNFVDHIKRKYPGLIVKNFRNGFFDEKNTLKDYIKSFEPSDIVIIGMGAPLQEQVALCFKDSKKARVSITCGGFITQTAGKDDYYYDFVKRFNLRWLQRLVLHSHVRKKFFSMYPKFFLRFVVEFFQGYKKT